MVETFDEFIDKKRSKSPNRAYEHKYPENLDLIKELLQQCHDKRTSTMWSLYSYRSIAEYMYYGLEMTEISLETLKGHITNCKG